MTNQYTSVVHISHQHFEPMGVLEVSLTSNVKHEMSMGDEILIHTVLAASGPLKEKTPPTKLSELSVDQILESVTGCLKVIAAKKKEILKSYPWLRDGVTTQGNVSTR